MAPKPPWSDLPQELLSNIADFLTSNPLDVVTFRSICKSWHSSSPSVSCPILSPPLPLIIPTLPNTLRDRSSRNRPCVIYVTVIFSFRPPLELLGPNIWVCFVDRRNKHKLDVRETFSRYNSMSVKFPKTLNMLEFHASELGRFYNLVSLDENYSRTKNLTIRNLRLNEARKAILLSDMSAALILSEEGKLGLIRLQTEQWEIIHDGKGYRIDNIIEFKGTILGVDRRGRVYEIHRLNSDKSFIVNMIVPTFAGGGGKRKRLVESLGKMYLVVRCKVYQKGVAFKVYHLLLDEINKEWEQVTEIGDRIFMFDIGFSLSVSTQQLGGIYRKDSIVYNDCSFGKSHGGFDDDDYKLFSGLRQHKIGVCHLEDAAQIGLIESYPSYCKLLWPPPSWLKYGLVLTEEDQECAKVLHMLGNSRYES